MRGDTGSGVTGSGVVSAAGGAASINAACAEGWSVGVIVHGSVEVPVDSTGLAARNSPVALSIGMLGSRVGSVELC